MKRSRFDLLRAIAVVLFVNLTLLNLTMPSGVVGIAHADPGEGIAYCQCTYCGGAAYCAYQTCDTEHPWYSGSFNGICNDYPGACVYVNPDPPYDLHLSFITCDEYGCVLCWPE